MYGDARVVRSVDILKFYIHYGIKVWLTESNNVNIIL